MLTIRGNRHMLIFLLSDTSPDVVGFGVDQAVHVNIPRIHDLIRSHSMRNNNVWLFFMIRSCTQQSIVRNICSFRFRRKLRMNTIRMQPPARNRLMSMPISSDWGSARLVWTGNQAGEWRYVLTPHGGRGRGMSNE